MAECSPGSFIAGLISDSKLVVKDKQSNNCVVELQFLGNSSPLDGLAMNCAVPLTIKDTGEMTNYLLGNKFQSCSGELKDKVTAPITEVMPELRQEPVGCTNAECANRLLSSCEKGSFTTKTADGFELKFTIRAKAGANCVAVAEFTNNPNRSLVGPKMTCGLPSSTKTLADIDNLVKNKYIVSDVYSESNVCSGELYKLIK